MFSKRISHNCDNRWPDSRTYHGYGLPMNAFRRWNLPNDAAGRIFRRSEVRRAMAGDVSLHASIRCSMMMIGLLDSVDATIRFLGS